MSKNEPQKDGERIRLRVVLGLLRPYPGWVAIIVVAMALQTLASLAAPWPLKVVIDHVVGGHPLPHWLLWLHAIPLDDAKLQAAGAAALMVIAIAVINAVAGYVENYYSESVSQWVAHDLRMRLYDHLQRLSLGYYDRHQTGPLLSTVTSDVRTIQSFASSGTLGIFVDLLTIAGMLALMFAMEFDYTLVAVGCGPFLAWFVLRFNREVKQATHEVRKHQSEIVSVVDQGLQSVRVVQAFDRQELEEKRLSAVSRATVDAALAARRVKSLLSPAVTVTAALCTAFVVWRGTGQVLAGAMTLGALTVFLSYLSKFFKPVQDLAKMSSSIAQTQVALERIQAILDTDEVLPQSAQPRDPGRLRGEIAFEGVAFAYDPQAPVLREVNLTIRPGERIGVVGPTGSGKSTVVSMIPRFYDPHSGTVRIDGVDARDYDVHALRRQIGMVLQDTSLFQGTIRDNIAYGRPEASDDEIRQAARLANAAEFVERLPGGYDTVVGERGATLSGGQRQRIGIARAILRNAPLLILDEPTAALDTESEKLVIEALERLMQGRTTITIAHRLSTIRHADRIVVLKDGVVAEQGSHDELLAARGVYAELHRIQMEDGGGAAAHA